MVASDRISAYDFILPDEIPHKGEILTRISAFWFERFADLIPNHMISCDVADLPAAYQPYADYLAGRSMLVRKARDRACSSASCAATSPGPARRPTTRTARCAASSCPTGSPRRPSCPSPSSPRPPRRRSATTMRTSPIERCCEIVGETWRAAPRRVARHLQGGRRLRRHPRHHHRRHQVRVWLHRRQAHPHRRVPHPRLEPLLARGRLRGGQGPAELRQAVRSRLAARELGHDR